MNKLAAFRENKKSSGHFPKRLTGIQMEKLQLPVRAMMKTMRMQELESIIHFILLRNESGHLQCTESMSLSKTTGHLPVELYRWIS